MTTHGPPSNWTHLSHPSAMIHKCTAFSYQRPRRHMCPAPSGRCSCRVATRHSQRSRRWAQQLPCSSRRSMHSSRSVPGCTKCSEAKWRCRSCQMPNLSNSVDVKCANYNAVPRRCQGKGIARTLSTAAEGLPARALVLVGVLCLGRPSSQAYCCRLSGAVVRFLAFLTSWDELKTRATA